MKHKKIAIIGAGTAGLAAAAFLQRSGHAVTLFEKFQAPKPMGAGLLLQPTGLAVLALLGLDQQIIDEGSIIHQLYGKVCGSNQVSMDVKYKDVSPQLFGVGTHRGNLFAALYQQVIALGVEIKVSNEITGVLQQFGKGILINDKAEQISEFDLIIDASGQKSLLRKQYADVKRDKPYAFGALWSVAKMPSDVFSLNTLEQRYKGAFNMLGVLPVGKLNQDTCTSAAFFWSLPVVDYPRFLSQPFANWQQEVITLWPETESLILQFHTHEDLILATYSDVVLNHYHNGIMAFIGDAAHCTSPQLGQGANLALVDAYVLADCINRFDSVVQALAEYSCLRKNHIRFYQQASRLLTPFFQSKSRLMGPLRYILCGVLARKIPALRRMTAQVLTGTKTGLFSSLNPGDWAR